VDFNEIEDQIELNKDRLKDESERYNEIRSRIGFISIVYTLFAAYGFQLILYSIRGQGINAVYFIALFAFIGLVIFSVVNAVRLLIPIKIAHRDLPSYFYNDIKNEYLESGIPEEDSDAYIKHTYKLQLEVAVKTNFDINNRKSKFHFYAFVTALFAIIPYLICIGMYIYSEKEKTVKVELVNKIFEDMSKQEKDSTSSQQAKTTIDTSKVIVKKPIMIRENQNKEQGQKPNKDGRGQEKN